MAGTYTSFWYYSLTVTARCTLALQGHGPLSARGSAEAAEVGLASLPEEPVAVWSRSCWRSSVTMLFVERLQYIQVLMSGTERGTVKTGQIRLAAGGTASLPSLLLNIALPLSIAESHMVLQLGLHTTPSARLFRTSISNSCPAGRCWHVNSWVHGRLRNYRNYSNHTFLLSIHSYICDNLEVHANTALTASRCHRHTKPHITQPAAAAAHRGRPAAGELIQAQRPAACAAMPPAATAFLMATGMVDMMRSTSTSDLSTTSRRSPASAGIGVCLPATAAGPS
jgi:hypothetical protein